MATETITCNLPPFSVFNFVDDFTTTLITRYKHLQLHHTLTKPFLHTLLSLLHLTHTEHLIQHELTHDLHTYDQQYPRSAIARSPISESMDDIFDEDSESNEEINRLWDIGEPVSRTDISRLFETTVSLMESTFDDAGNQNGIVGACQGLVRLREFDEGFFTELVSGWVRRVKYSGNGLAVFRALSSFVAGGCVGVEMLVGEGLREGGEGGSVMGDYAFVAGCLELVVRENPFGTALGVKVCSLSLSVSGMCWG